MTTSVGRRAAGSIAVEKLRGVGVAVDHPLGADLVAAFNLAGLRAQAYPNGPSMKWSKMLTNLLANASSAILDMPPSAIFAHPGLFRLEAAMLKEALAVMAGPIHPRHRFAFDAGAGADLDREKLCRRDSASRCWCNLGQGARGQNAVFSYRSVRRARAERSGLSEWGSGPFWRKTARRGASEPLAQPDLDRDQRGDTCPKTEYAHQPEKMIRAAAAAGSKPT